MSSAKEKSLSGMKKGIIVGVAVVVVLIIAMTIVFTVVIPNCKANETNVSFEIVRDIDVNFDGEVVKNSEGRYFVTKDPIRNGYIFEGWYVDDTLLAKATDEVGFIKNEYVVGKELIKIFPKWTLVAQTLLPNKPSDNNHNEIIPEPSKPVKPTPIEPSKPIEPDTPIVDVAPMYKVLADSTMRYGQVVLEKMTYIAGSKVTFSMNIVKNAQGKVAMIEGSVVVKCGQQIVDISFDDDKKEFSFVMPKGNVSIFADYGFIASNGSFASQGMTYAWSNGHYVLKGIGTCSEKMINVPQYFDDGINGIAKVTEIGDKAFELKEIVGIEFSNVTIIGEGAFYLCKELEIIDFSNIIEVKKNAFNSCHKIKKVNLSNCKIVGEGAFAGCKNVEYVDIRNVGKDSLGNVAFSGCVNLKTVYYNANMLDNVLYMAFTDYFEAKPEVKAAIFKKV